MYYYVDFENVQSVGMHGVEELTENDRVCVFYSELNCRLTFSLMQDILRARAAIEFIEVKTGGQNALDFQLSTKLGYDVAGSPDETFVIISKDNGFNAVLHFWRKNGVNIFQHRNISQAELIINGGFRSIAEDPELEKIINLIPEYPGDAQKVSEIINSCESKSDIHTMLVKEYGFPKTSYIYNSIKPLIKNKKAVQEVKQSLPEKAPAAEETAPAEAAKDAAPEAKKRGRPKKQKPPTVSELVPQYSEDTKRIEEIIGKYKTKLGINRALMREYGSGKAEKIYGLITPLIKDKKGKDADA